jgi:hypothetical protein
MRMPRRRQQAASQSCGDGAAPGSLPHQAETARSTEQELRDEAILAFGGE